MCWVEQAHCTLLAASRLERCVEASSSDLRCSQRFVLTVDVQNGDNSSESFVTYKLGSATDSDGNTFDLLDSVEITLAKSQVQLVYPLTYDRNYNAQPVEVLRTHDATGRSFNWLTNPCVDDISRDGACGWVIDDARQHVPASNGFCCRCSLGECNGMVGWWCEIIKQFVCIIKQLDKLTIIIILVVPRYTHYILRYTILLFYLTSSLADDFFSSAGVCMCVCVCVCRYLSEAQKRGRTTGLHYLWPVPITLHPILQEPAHHRALV